MTDRDDVQTPVESDFVPADGPRWGLAWQLPVMVAAVAAITAAVFYRQPADTGPDPAQLLVDARAELDSGQLAVAEQRLGLVEPLLAEHPSLLGDYHLAVADYRLAIVTPIRSAAPGLAAQVVDAYRQAVRDGARLDVRRRTSLVLALVAADDDAEALRELDGLWPHLSEVDRQALRSDRLRLMQEWVDRAIAREPVDYPMVRSRVDEVLSLTPGVELDAWAIAVDARIRLRQGDLDGLARHLGLAMHRIEGRCAEVPDAQVDWPVLWLLLGHAYRDELSSYSQAQECYRTVVDRLRAGGTVQVEATRSLAELLVVEARHETDDSSRLAAIDEASRRYHELAEDLPDAGVEDVFAARRGLAEVQMLVAGDHPRHVLDRLSHAESFLEALGPAGISESSRDRLATVALDAGGATLGLIDAWHETGDEAATVEGLRIVIEKAAMVSRLTADLELRRRALDILARSNEWLAQTLLEPHLGGADPRRFTEFDQVPVEIQLEAFGGFASAAEAMDAYERTLSSDDPERASVIWKSAVLHDKSGAIDDALSRYVRFVESESVDVPLWPEAMYRVAVCHHASGDLSAAEEGYRRLLEHMDGKADQVSEFTTRGRVGLARVLLDRGQARGIAEAESLLHQVVAGTADDAIGPSVPEYRDALLQLVRLLADMERWSELGSRGDEWLRRYPEDDRWGEVAARTGIAFVRHAEALVVDASTAEGAGTPRAIVVRRGEREKSLEFAERWLAEAIAVLDSRPDRPLDGLEHRLLRESYLHRAAAADRQGDVVGAVGFYREAEQRFAGEAVAVMALIAMADVATRGGDAETATEATRRARKRLQHLHRGVGGIGRDAQIDLFRGGDPATLDRWLTVFPPGLEDEIG